MSPSLRLLASTALLARGALSAPWPEKTLNYADDGDACDFATEQYMQVETYDFHDYPKVTMIWRQLTGACGEPTTDFKEWSATYDVTAGDTGPDAEYGRVQLNLFLCVPFGEYEIELHVESYSDPGSALEQRTAWEVESGKYAERPERKIWNSVDSYLATDPVYSPIVPGNYTWPIPGDEGFYSVMFAGPLPPLECKDSAPEDYVYLGCYEDSPSDRLLPNGPVDFVFKGPDGLTPEVCAETCSDYEYFGLEYGYECFCGTADDFASAKESEECGMDYIHYCTGDAYTVCGGKNALNVYKKSEKIDAPVYLGCYADVKGNRDMPDTGRYTNLKMTAELCVDYCGEKGYKYAGTQYGAECWCSNSYGSHGVSDKCDYECAGDPTEICGGYDALSVYGA